MRTRPRFAKRSIWIALGAIVALAVAFTSTASAITGLVEGSAPKITGTTRDGSILTIYHGNWYGETPITFAYKWELCNSTGAECAAIPGAETEKYKLIHEDVGRTLRGIVTATNPAASDTVTSAPSKVIAPLAPKKVKQPTITGLADDGQVLAASNGVWLGTPPLTYAYQWQDCVKTTCTPITGAHSQTYRVETSQIGKKIRVAVTAKNVAGSATSTSYQTKAVIAGPPVNVGAPTVSGTPIDGQTLTGETGTWAGTPPFTFAYQWYSCSILTDECSKVPGAMSPTYQAGPLDVGSAFEVEVTATNGHGKTSAMSAQTSVISALLPENATLPSIAGSLIDGQLLSAVLGTWTGTPPLSYAYEWLQCDASGSSCKTISEDAASTLSLTSALVGSTIRVAVTATNSGGSTKAISQPTTIVGALAPSNVSLPSIAGSLIDGETLSALTGSWNGTGPLSYAYQWQKCDAAGEACKDISSAEAATLGVVSSLVGDTLRVVVTATNAAGSATATSGPTSPVGALLPSNVSLPSIAGGLIDGETITALTGGWKGTGPLSYSYQWQKCDSLGGGCENISGAEASTLGLVSGLVGEEMRVIVTATNSAGSVQATSGTTNPIAALLPSNTSLPSVLGSPLDGQTLSAATGSWNGTTPLTYSYKWEQCNAAGEACKAIEGATGTTLGIVSTLVGDTVRVVVTATNAGGSVSAPSPASGVIAGVLPGVSSLPTVGGVLEDGKTLTAAVGSWTGSTPISYGYQWQRCNSKGESCSNINGAEAATLGLVSSLVGDTVRVIVTATNSAGSTEAASAATTPILAILPGNTSLPSVVGTPIDGQTLTAANGSWSGTAPISYAYKWEQCNAKGEACKEISGAEAGTLGLVSSLVGDTIRVAVTGSNSRGSTTATSPATSVIQALLPGNTALPTIAGSPTDGQTLTASNGSWKGTAPISYSDQWQQCNSKGESCSNIGGAEAATLGLVSSLVGDTVRVVVKATNSGGSTEQASAATSVIAALLPKPLSAPTVSSSTKEVEQGSSLKAASNGSWEGTSPISYSYQWQQCNGKGEGCTALTGETKETLGVAENLVKSTVRLVVKATNSGGSTEAASAPTSAVLAALPVNTVLPTINGLLEAGKTLTAQHETWSGTQNGITYGYQWQLCGALGLVSECKNIAGATTQSFLLELLDVSLTLRVGVTATNERGTSQTAYSKVTGLIKT